MSAIFGLQSRNGTEPVRLAHPGVPPATSADGRFTLIFDGALYNASDLERDLAVRGCRLRGASDTELLLEGFAAFGPDLLERLNGIFALALHDSASGDVLVARDPLGVKPLYYAQNAGGVGFAGTIQALAKEMALDRALDMSALRKYLTFLWCPGEQTPLRAVKKLAPGTALLLRGGDIARRWTFWQMPDYRPRAGWNRHDCAEELKALIETCVARQATARVPAGAFLSGGLDSSAIVAAMRAPGVPCFTVDPHAKDYGATEDLPYARQVAAQLGADLHVVPLEPRVMAARAADLAGLLDEPLADPAALNVLFIAEAARAQGIGVLLSGVGADDIFGGYRRHRIAALDPVWSAIPSPLRRALTAAAPLLGWRAAWALASFQQDRNARVMSSLVWGGRTRAAELLSREAMAAAPDGDVFAPFEHLLAGQPDIPLLEKCLALDRRFFLSDHLLNYTHKMGLAGGVEIRAPLVDVDLVRFAAEIPAEWKIRRLKSKAMFKQSQAGVLPRNVIERPKNAFGVPLRRWLRGELRDMAESLLSPQTIAARGLFDPAAIAKLRREDTGEAQDRSYTLFSLMCIELWCRTFLDGGANARGIG